VRISQGSWSLEKHPLWDAVHDEDCLTLTCTDDGGAFQLSSARKSNGNVTDEDIDWCVRDCADGTNGEWSHPTPVVFGAFGGSHIAATLDGVFWTWWIIGCGPVLLSASYNGPPSYAKLELQHVESMLGTLAAA
jgi:hypothetical protein